MAYRGKFGLIIHRSNKHYAIWDRRGRDRMIVGFTTTCAISAYHQ